MSVYREMDIGTSKPSRAQQAEVPHHLLDLVDPDEEFTVSQFQQAAQRALEAIAARGHHALLVGGTGLYLRAVVDDLRFPGRYPTVREALESELGEGRAEVPELHARLAVLDPVAACVDGAFQPAPRGAGAGGHTRVREALLDVRARSRGLSAFRGDHGGPFGPHRRGRPPHRRAVRAVDGGGPVGRGPGPGHPARRHLPDGPPGPGLSRAAGPRGGGCALGCLQGGSRAPDPVLRPPPGVVVPA